MMSAFYFEVQQLVDFIKEVVGEPTVLVGNSIGSLACLIASAGNERLLHVIAYHASISLTNVDGRT